MLDFIGGVFTAYFLTWQAIGLMFLLGILFEHGDKRGTAVFLSLLLAFVSFQYFGLTLKELAIYASGYLVFGLGWSFWRYKRHVDTVVESAQSAGKEVRQRVAYELMPTKMWPTITAWIMVWPFSLIENLTRDIITAVEQIVRKVFRGVYNKIYNAGVSKLNIQ